MLSVTRLATFVSFVSSVAALTVPRTTPPAGWSVGYLEARLTTIEGFLPGVLIVLDRTTTPITLVILHLIVTPSMTQHFSSNAAIHFL